MLMLAMHPDLQQRVYDECKSLITELAGGDITNDSIANLKYLEMFIKETLRLFPAVPFLTRATTSELVVGVCDHWEMRNGDVAELIYMQLQVTKNCQRALRLLSIACDCIDHPNTMQTLRSSIQITFFPSPF